MSVDRKYSGNPEAESFELWEGGAGVGSLVDVVDGSGKAKTQEAIEYCLEPTMHTVVLLN